MEDWVKRQHQTGMRMRQRFRTVQNPIARAQAREKVQSRNSHPDVIAKLEATNEGNKRKFIASSEKKDDLLLTKRKRQRDIGRCETMKYSDENKDKR